MMFLEVILVITVSFGARAQEGQACQSEITAMSQKITEMYDAFFNGVPAQNNENKTLYASCKLHPNTKLNADEIKITGYVLFKQVYPYGRLEAVFSIEGFPQDVNQSSRAIHIHDFGDLSNGCDSAGGHYNPYFVDHPNHPGDFGNYCVRNGKIQQHLMNLEANIYGRVSVIGRSIVVHKMADDLGKGNNRASLENGNAGTRLACCVIGATNKNSWEKYMEENANSNSQRVARCVNRQQKKPK
ncbi:PREDICTED: extracellular superoxide dismutase [Cu-Zn]-like [Nanorana parkeri]|uniref:extracellular superoxide dismutase [Cu-Zn]-like n=1 Tax=Nanorana parkeri TaxID=125878 RepID=UPI0008550859|nr:PREDICTED: extracellular superoxide dismutase [Cu-Zn]-like [Nanorana parkeri]